MSTQKGGFYPGMILGFLLGVAVSLGVGLYVTKAPIPFIDKVPQRSSQYDAAEAERNRTWDPNAPLQGRSAARPASPAPAPAPAPQPQPSPYYPDVPAPAEAPAARTPAEPVAPGAATPRAAERGSSTRDPAAILSGRPSPAPAPAPAAAPSAAAGYFVQTGAFARVEDAEQQRARLAMLGLSARITERDQSGRIVYRVRVGPFDAREDAESTRERIAGSGLDAALVSVAR